MGLWCLGLYPRAGLSGSTMMFSSPCVLQIESGREGTRMRILRAPPPSSPQRSLSTHLLSRSVLTTAYFTTDLDRRNTDNGAQNYCDKDFKSNEIGLPRRLGESPWRPSASSSRRRGAQTLPPFKSSRTRSSFFHKRIIFLERPMLYRILQRFCTR